MLVYINYKKIVFNKDNNKKVRWNSTKSIIHPHYNNPEFDYFDSYNNGIEEYALFKNNINSNITKYLDNMADSYKSVASDTYPIKASIPEDPELVESIQAREIVNNADPNTRVLEYRNDPKIYDSMEVGNVYDSLVNNFRVEWGKFEDLNAHDQTNYYDLSIAPDDMGYTNFATY
jgi:hypothetical protein